MLVLSLILVSLLVEASVLFLMLLFPVGYLFNIYYLKYVLGVHKHSPVSLSIEPATGTARVVFFDKTELNGAISSVRWNSPGLVVLVVRGQPNGMVWLPVYKDGTESDEFHQLKVWLNTCY